MKGVFMPVYDKQWAENVGGYLRGGMYDVENGDPKFVEEFKLILKYAKKLGGPILELACGAGRVMFPLAKEGFEIWGIDLSESMLALGKEKLKDLLPQTRKLIHFGYGDMCNFRFSKGFSLIFIAYDSFWTNLNYLNAETCLERVIEHLRLKGAFIIDSPIFSNRLSDDKGKIKRAEFFHTMSERLGFKYEIIDYKDGDGKFLGSALVGHK